MIGLDIAAREIREILETRRKELGLSFMEEGHIYYMKGNDGTLRDDFPSVSTVEKLFYDEFDAEEKALQKCHGDVEKQKIILAEWKALGDYASNQGSRAHFELEKYAIGKFGIDKEVREPAFDCNDKQVKDSNRMISAGKDFINLMGSRGCHLVDTEVVMGDPILGYVGQTDNMWIMENGGEISAVVTDHKTNKPENLIVKPYNGYMRYPFDGYRNYALTHYYLQLPLYFRLFKEMLKGSKYEDIRLSGCIIDSIRSDGSFVEYRIPKDFYQKVIDIDIKSALEDSVR